MVREGECVPRFVCIDDDVPPETFGLLKGACEERNVAFEVVDAPGFDYLPERRLEPGNLLYNPATSHRSETVERHLYVPGVVDMRDDPLGPFSMVGGAPELFVRAGLPTPRFFYVGAVTAEYIRGLVSDLGGFPVVVKVPGGSSGVGVMRADALPSLLSLLEFLVSKGALPLMSSYIEPARVWRVIVVGSNAVAACKNPITEGDFRSGQSERPEDYSRDVLPDLASLAVDAVAALRLQFGGVDVVEHHSGRLYLLEANFPCYFAPAQQVAGIDVAGALVDFLLEKRRRMGAM
jgi:hypothetical protein